MKNMYVENEDEIIKDLITEKFVTNILVVD